MFSLLNNRLFKQHLDDDEEVVMVVHRHWVLGVKQMFLPVAVFLFLGFILVTAPKREVLYIVGSLLVIVGVWGLRNFFDYYLDAWLITDSGIADVEWHGWFHRESSKILYSDIQGVSYEIKGVINTMLRYGTISVEKVSTGSEIAMENVTNPRAIEAVILRNMEEYLHKKNLKDASTVQDILSSVIAREIQLKDFEKKESTRSKS